VDFSVLKSFGVQIDEVRVSMSDANPSLFHEKKPHNPFFFPKIMTKRGRMMGFKRQKTRTALCTIHSFLNVT
jgi:hypothetical protein